MTEPSGVAQFERRLRAVPGFLAFELQRYRDLTHREASEAFDLPLESLSRLGVCRRPRRDQYQADVQAIATRVGVPTAGLANFLRAVDTLAALAQRPSGSAAASRDQRGLLLAARDHTDEHTEFEDPSDDASLPGWLGQAIERFWGDDGQPAGFPRDLHLPILMNLPLAIIEIEGLTVSSLDQWLRGHRLPELAAVADRPLRGCLTAYAGVGVVFVDRSDDAEQRRLTLAHEAGHFVVDYLLPREAVIRRRPDLVEVLDGERPPTDAEQFDALLADVPIGFHAHLLERDAHGGHLSAVTTSVEDRAERMALELLAPLHDVLGELDQAKDHDLGRILRDRFGLPAGAATRYGSHVRQHRPNRPRTLFESIGLTPPEDKEPGDAGEDSPPSRP
jgi:hypothetical protein